MTPLFSIAPEPRASASLPSVLRSIAEQGERVLVPLASGRQLVCHAFGQPNAWPPLVLLHGGSGSWTHWARNVLPLAGIGASAQRHGGSPRWVLAFDLPGFGESDVLPGMRDADDLVEPLAVGIRALCGSQPVHLVGFSFGGLTAGLLAQAHGALVERLVIVGAPGMGLVPPGMLPLKGWRHLPSAAEQREVHRHNLRVLMLHHEAALDDLALDIQQNNVPFDRLPGRRLAFTPALRDALPGVRVPVDVIYGEHDALYEGLHTELEQAYRACCPTLRSFQLIANAGHWVPYEQPQAFERALHTCLSAAPL